MTVTAEHPVRLPAGHQHRPWCQGDLLYLEGAWSCVTDYEEIPLSRGRPFTCYDGETVPDRLSLCMEQGSGEAAPLFWLTHGDVTSEAGHQIELTLAEAGALMSALGLLIARAVSSPA